MPKWKGPKQTEDLVTLVITNLSISVAYRSKGLFIPLFGRLLVSSQKNVLKVLFQSYSCPVRSYLLVRSQSKA